MLTNELFFRLLPRSRKPHIMWDKKRAQPAPPAQESVNSCRHWLAAVCFTVAECEWTVQISSRLGETQSAIIHRSPRVSLLWSGQLPSNTPSLYRFFRLPCLSPSGSPLLNCDQSETAFVNAVFQCHPKRLTTHLYGTTRLRKCMCMNISMDRFNFVWIKTYAT